MDVGMVGLPGSGKTSLFTALTGTAVSGFTEKPHLGVAKIPDPRLQTIARFVQSREIVHATVQLVDIPGVAGAGDPRKLNRFLEHVRQVDALCQVVRCFDDGTGPDGIDPAGDIQTMETELVLADLMVAESAAEKAAKVARTGDRDAGARLEVLQRVIEVLNEGRPARSLGELPEAEALILRGYGFVTAKPVLYVANIAEAGVAGEPAAARAVQELATATGCEALALCASLEAELAEIPEEEERQEMLESLGLTEPAIGPLARAASRLLGLTCFYTAGEKEIRAWPVRAGATAHEAAGAIHSDIQRGFIRAECYHVDDLVELGSEKAIREAGRLRSEGKGYQVRDGDVVHFLFNV